VSVPADVAAAWAWDGAVIERFEGGLINQTYVVRRGGEPIAALQRLHPIFAGPVNLDIEAVTTHLANHGLTTPRLLRTVGGTPWIEHDGHVWRALSWIAGVTTHRVPAPDWAETAGEQVGRFHRAVADLQHDYAFVRAGVHDTAAHLGKLAAHVAAEPGEAADLGREILDAAAELPPLPTTPRRHCHGDLKISNVIFAAEPLPRAISLVDLDTLGRGTLAFELGDALRSWCNLHGEDAGAVTFDLPVFVAAIRGFRSVADPFVSQDELVSIVTGLGTVCLELAARFCVDVFRDEYFGWDPARFASRRDHNLVRARGQLALGRAVRAARDAALEVVNSGR
jgi:Ser/Thr protein kinase RdoA (MazF antagonist)